MVLTREKEGNRCGPSDGVTDSTDEETPCLRSTGGLCNLSSGLSGQDELGTSAAARETFMIEGLTKVEDTLSSFSGTQRKGLTSTMLKRVCCSFCALAIVATACIYWYLQCFNSLHTQLSGRRPALDEAAGRSDSDTVGIHKTDFFTSWGSAEPYCNSSMQIVSHVAPRAFKLNGEWNSTCFTMEHPDASVWPGRNWCWAWMKHAGCYAHRGDITWHAAQEALADSLVVPHHRAQALEPLLDPNLCDVTAHGESENFTAEEEAEAMMWINKTVTFYVLNMDKNYERLAHFASRMSTLGLEWKRIPGVNVSAPGGMDKAVLEGLISPKFNYSAALGYARRNFSGMTGITGDVGTAAAHFRVMKYVESQATTPIAVVFEDDAYAHDGFAVRLYRMLLGEAPCDWEAITLRSRCSYGQCISKHLSRVTPDGNEPQTRCRHGVNYGFYGMVYRKNAVHHIVEKLMPIVWNEEHPHCLDIDVALASISDTVAFYAVPSSQMPGFLQEKPMGSNRRDVNKIDLMTSIDS